MSNKKSDSIVDYSSFDNSSCVRRALSEAEVFCRDNRLRFTKVRRRTLGILLESHTAMGAYEVLDRLRLEGLGSKPPVAYRALSFLLENGFVHRIERLNAFVACSHPGSKHHPVFLICTDCGSVAETSVNPTSDVLSKTAQKNGFQIRQSTLEAEGQCPDCQQDANL